jgi:hypothetical protein
MCTWGRGTPATAAVQRSRALGQTVVAFGAVFCAGDALLRAASPSPCALLPCTFRSAALMVDGNSALDGGHPVVTSHNPRADILLDRYFHVADDGDQRSALLSQWSYYIALNLYNSEDVLPQLADALVLLARALGPADVFVSIYENGTLAALSATGRVVLRAACYCHGACRS